MVGVRAWGLMMSDPQRAHVALAAVAGIATFPEGVDGVGIASIVDGAALLSRLPAPESGTEGGTAPEGAQLARLVGPLKGRCAVLQMRTRHELRPNSAQNAIAGGAPMGPFRARSYAAAVVGGPADADGASALRERLLAGVPDFLRRFVTGAHEGEAFFLATLARLHTRGLLDSPHNNGTALLDAAREVLELHPTVAKGAPRQVTLTNGVEIIHVAFGLPSAIVTLNGLPEAVADALDPTLADSSMGRERLRRFRGVLSLGALETPLKASLVAASSGSGVEVQVLPEAAVAVVQRDLSVKLG